MKTLFLKPFIWFCTGFFLVFTLFACQPQQVVELPEIPTATPVQITTPVTDTRPVGYLDRPLSTNPAELPPLPYAENALEKAIDAETMKLHHDGHHAAYVNNLNDALRNQPNLQNRSVEALLRDLNSVPEDIRRTVRNNGGGHLNHTIFWQIMSPQGGRQPTGEIAQEINQTFGSFEQFRNQFNQAGGDRFGSGWVWLVRNPQGQLQITTTPFFNYSIYHLDNIFFLGNITLH
ncbi:superoxide dismutase [Anabaena sp. UHCC 0451]|uniref:superoxide dismutase n=1 Tax=Anabaena sp. UHCC 0451 TaxID=2055235 RepID=UPI002B1F3F07|nr:superoxide dismutase [Anabaena sp. UHCC 0451]MEA5576084.1 superoxide dismutase [Anabaena sp. UHCC 0451]